MKAAVSPCGVVWATALAGDTATLFHKQKDRTIVAERVQDVEPVLENNARLRSQPQSRHSTFRHKASIPNIILEQWLNEEYERGHHIRFLSKEMDELVARKLRDPDWAKLSTDSQTCNLYSVPKINGLKWGD